MVKEVISRACIYRFGLTKSDGRLRLNFPAGGYDCPQV
jgi:hypothetical protein